MRARASPSTASETACSARRGPNDGDRLLLTKPLGTGVVFAADMRAEAPSEVVEAALASMLLSNGAAARIFRDSGARACTDVTGFGLLGHLVEMLRAGDVDAELDLDAIPRLPGTSALVEGGVRSSPARGERRLWRRPRRPPTPGTRGPRFSSTRRPPAGSSPPSLPSGRTDAWRRWWPRVAVGR